MLTRGDRWGLVAGFALAAFVLSGTVGRPEVLPDTGPDIITDEVPATPPAVPVPVPDPDHRTASDHEARDELVDLVCTAFGTRWTA